jgi:hypothetical protein
MDCRQREGLTLIRCQHILLIDCRSNEPAIYGGRSLHAFHIEQCHVQRDTRKLHGDAGDVAYVWELSRAAMCMADSIVNPWLAGPESENAPGLLTLPGVPKLWKLMRPLKENAGQGKTS